MKKGIVFVIVLMTFILLAALGYFIFGNDSFPFKNIIGGVSSDISGNAGMENGGEEISEGSVSEGVTGNVGLADDGGGGDGGGRGGTGSGADLGSSAEDGGRGAFLTDGQTGKRAYCAEQGVDVCDEEPYSVCGWLDPTKVACTEGPCVQRFASWCEACMDEMVIYWTEGECPFHG